MTTLVLIEADEGSTRSVFVAEGSARDLKRVVREAKQLEIDSWLAADNSDNRAENCAYIQSECVALLAMIDAHNDWHHGRYLLENVEPHWQEWNLIVVDGGEFLNSGDY